MSEAMFWSKFCQQQPLDFLNRTLDDELKTGRNPLAAKELLIHTASKPPVFLKKKMFLKQQGLQGAEIL